MRLFLNVLNGPMMLIPGFHKSHIKNSLKMVLLACVLSACAGVPVQEMSNARQALEAARKVGAETRASNELKSAETLLQSAEQALEDGDYSRARQDALDSRDQAVQAQDKSLNE